MKLALTIALQRGVHSHISTLHRRRNRRGQHDHFEYLPTRPLPA